MNFLRCFALVCLLFVLLTSTYSSQVVGQDSRVASITLQQPETSPADLNADGIVNIADISSVAIALGSKAGDSDWNEKVDMDKNDVVDIKDVTLAVKLVFSEDATSPGSGQLPVLVGFCLSQSAYGNARVIARLTSQQISRLREMSMNSLNLIVMWSSQIEQSQYKPGIYNEVNLRTLRNNVDALKSVGIQPVISLQCGSSFPGWATAEYVCENSKGLQRYLNLLKMIASRFSDCIIDPFWFVYHQTPVTEWQRKNYYENVFPKFLSAIRQFSNMPVIFEPIHHGWRIPPSESKHIGTGEYYYLTRDYDDDKLYYGISNTDNRIFIEGASWNYNTDWVRHCYDGIDKFVSKFGQKQFILSEGLSLRIHGSPYEPLDPSRVAWVRAHLQVMKERGISWLYFSLTEHYPEFPFEQDEAWSHTAVSLVIREYARLA